MEFLGGVDHEPFLSRSSKMSNEYKLVILVTFLAHLENLEDESPSNVRLNPIKKQKKQKNNEENLNASRRVRLTRHTRAPQSHTVTSKNFIKEETILEVKMMKHEGNKQQVCVLLFQLLLKIERGFHSGSV